VASGASEKLFLLSNLGKIEKRVGNLKGLRTEKRLKKKVPK